MTEENKAAYQRFWNKRRDYTKRAKEQGIVLTRVAAGRIQVTVPFTEEFVKEAHHMGGRWRKRTEMWSFRASVRPRLFEVLDNLYGKENINRRVRPEPEAEKVKTGHRCHLCGLVKIGGRPVEWCDCLGVGQPVRMTPMSVEDAVTAVLGKRAGA
jgi:hypothetical protein